MHRLGRLFRLLMLGAAVEAAAAIAWIISMRGDHEIFVIVIAVLCFPYSIMLGGPFTMPRLLLAIFQFPAYALLGWLLEPIRPRWNGWIVPAVIHGVGVAAAIGVLASNFQT